MHGDHPQALALVETDGRRVVVGGDQPETAASQSHGLSASRLQQTGAQTLAWNNCVQRDDLQLVSVYPIGKHAATNAVQEWQ